MSNKDYLLFYRNSIFSRGRSLFRCSSKNCIVNDFFSVLWGDSLCDLSSTFLLVHSTSVCSATPKNISGFSGPGAGLVPGCLFLLSLRGRVHLLLSLYWTLALSSSTFLSNFFVLIFKPWTSESNLPTVSSCCSYFSMNPVELKLDDFKLAQLFYFRIALRESEGNGLSSVSL